MFSNIEGTDNNYQHGVQIEVITLAINDDFFLRKGSSHAIILRHIKNFQFALYKLAALLLFRMLYHN